MPGRKKRNQNWRRRNERKSNRKDDDIEDPRLIQKRKEIEEALAQQRARRRLEEGSRRCGDEDNSMHIANERVVQRIPGHYYDEERKRYFKLDKSSASIRREKLGGESRVPLKETLVEKVTLLSVLSRKIQGLRVGIADIMSPLTSRLQAEKLPNLNVSPSDAMAYHPVYGLAVSDGPNILRFTSGRLPSSLSLRTALGPQILSLAWHPDSSVPLLAALKHQEDDIDQIEFYNFVDADGVTSSSPVRTISGVLPSRHEKEIFQSIRWANDGSACFSGGDIGLWKHDVGGRWGRHLILDGISTVNVIDIRSPGCIAVGLRTGLVIDVDEREKTRKGRTVATMGRSIDHIHTLSDGYSFVCQDITNNVLLYDVRFPNKCVHAIRGSFNPHKPRGFSYYEGETAVRNRKFWVSPISELVLLSAGTRGNESLTILNPRIPVASSSAGESSNVLHSIQATDIVCNYDMNAIDEQEGNGTNVFWKLIENHHVMPTAEECNLSRVSSEWKGCFAMSIQCFVKRDRSREIMSSASCVRLFEEELK